MPTEATVPVSSSVVASVVMATAWPALRLARSALPTLPSSFQVLVEITTNWAVLAVEASSAASSEPELPLPVTVSPSSRLTLATVPLMGERSTASSRFVLACGEGCLRRGHLRLGGGDRGAAAVVVVHVGEVGLSGGEVGRGQVDGVLQVGVVDAGQLLTLLDGLAGLHVHGGDGAGDAEVHVRLLARAERAVEGHRHRLRALGHLNGAAARRGGGGLGFQQEPGADPDAGQHDDGQPEDQPFLAGHAETATRQRRGQRILRGRWNSRVPADSQLSLVRSPPGALPTLRTLRQ